MRTPAPSCLEQGLVILGFFAIGALAPAAKTAKPGTERTALVVNHHEVSREEFGWFMEQERAIRLLHS
jgi:hypothetical protein